MTTKKTLSFDNKAFQNLVDIGPGTPSDLEQRIRVRAYELFEQRGCAFGHDLDDWLRAEAEALGKGRSANAA